MKKRLAILGSTGSVGVTTLSVVERFRDRFEVVALAAGKNLARLREQVLKFAPKLVSVSREDSARELGTMLSGFGGEIVWGDEGIEAAATRPDVDLVVSALVGAAGLRPTLAAIRSGRDIALANKEALVVSGELMTQEAKRAGVRLLPVDSEHNAIFQVLRERDREALRRVILTASGGPFLHCPLSELARVTPQQALRHPTWKMGDKITVDSATLMNKGFEVIEAHWLFDLPPERIAVIVHPQSIVHSLVEYVDGSVLAQLGVPDMAIPVSHVLAFPDRLPMGHLPSLDLAAVSSLTFSDPDLERFPCLRLAYRALDKGGTSPAVLNAANEVTVEGFLAGWISFTDIASINRRVLEAHEPAEVRTLEDVLAADGWARAYAREACEAAGRTAAAAAATTAR
jgi:1-deoxy-D-xylulose-5-phosphate reductoisomerase